MELKTHLTWLFTLDPLRNVHKHRHPKNTYYLVRPCISYWTFNHPIFGWQTAVL